MKSLIILLVVVKCFGVKGKTPQECAAKTAENWFMSEESKTSAKNSYAKRQDVFANVKSTLEKETNVPLRLPQFIPEADKDNPIYAIVESADRQNYEVQLAWTKDCNGGNACHYGTVRGSVTPLPEEKRKKAPIKLERGIKGYFIGFTCGAHCDDSSLEWKEDGYYYSISIKAEKRETLIRVANSAILSGRKSANQRGR